MNGWDEFCKRHASESGKALETPLVRDVIKEQYGNITQKHGAEPDGLLGYGLAKIAATAAQVARAHALGFDPDLLRVSPAGAHEQQMEMMARALASDTEVIVIHPPPPE